MDVITENYELIAISFATTVLLFVFAGIGSSMLLGSLLVTLRVGPIGVMRRTAATYVTLVRNTPLLLILLFFSIAAPKIGIKFQFVDIVISTGWGDIRMTNAFAGAVVGLTLYTAAFVCEALRSGVNAVPVGQAEAARAIGLPFGGVMTNVVLPQALRAALPPLASTMIALLKNTTVAISVLVLEAAFAMRQLLNDYPGDRWALLRHVRRDLRGAGRDRLPLQQPARAPMEVGPMSQSVLFDAPGPRTIRRHRVYTVITVMLIAAAIAFTVYKLDQSGQFAAEKWEVFTTPDYIEFILVDGLLETLKMAACGIIGAVVLGLVLGIGKLSDHRFVRLPCWAVVEFFRAVPVLLLMIFFFSLYGIHHGTTGPFWCVVWALTLYNGAVLAEVFRAGVLAVPPGQAEAAYAVGMRKGQVMNIVLLPQAVKIMIPAIISQCVVTLKDTSLGYAIAAPGLTAVARPIYLEFQNHVPVYIVIAAIYIVVNLILTAIATLVQKRVRRGEEGARGADGRRDRPEADSDAAP